jgi:glycosyltransferase involved in cell wall biosynthesis
VGLKKSRHFSQRLTIDVGPLLEDQWTGIPIFTKRLVLSLMQIKNLELDFCYNLTSLPSNAVHDALRYGSGATLRSLYEAHSMSRFTKVDVTAPIIYPSVKLSFNTFSREASVIHDVSTLVMPETHDASNVTHHLAPLRQELASNQVTFCVSQATEAALTTNFPFLEGKTRVLYQFADWPAEFGDYDRNLPPIDMGQYAVVIGTIEPRKNLGLLFRALSHPALSTSGLKFVVIGRRGWKVDEALRELTPGARDRVSFTGFVSEFVKYRLLKHAMFLVYPSIYEGFGIPAVEAMSLGKPVVAAYTSSFPEVIQNAGVFFDPFSVDDFVSAVQEMLKKTTSAERDKLTTCAFEQAAKFGPDRMVQPVLDWLCQQ